VARLQAGGGGTARQHRRARPVEGLGRGLVEDCRVAGEGENAIPRDACARNGTIFDEAAPQALDKRRFHVLARDAALAGLKARYGDGTLTLSDGAATDRFDLSTGQGAADAGVAIARHLGLPEDARPRLVRGRGGHRFTDVSVVSGAFMQAVSMVNLATVADFARRTGATVEPERFRANIVIDGWPPWSELQLEGARIEAGEATLKGLLRTRRCAATTVNPATAVRDVPVPRLIMEAVGHSDLGLYVAVEAGGTLREGDTVRVA